MLCVVQFWFLWHIPYQPKIILFERKLNIIQHYFAGFIWKLLQTLGIFYLISLLAINLKLNCVRIILGLGAHAHERYSYNAVCMHAILE